MGHVKNFDIFTKQQKYLFLLTYNPLTVSLSSVQLFKVECLARKAVD